MERDETENWKEWVIKEDIQSGAMKMKQIKK